MRDGLICHCGEIDQQGVKPREEAIDLYSIKRPGLTQPFTWEGCIVKIADKIAYLGRDIEDARAYHILDMSSYRQLREIVGSTLGFEKKGAHALRSGKAVNTTVLINDLIIDLCEQSTPEKGLSFSDEYFRFILELKKFNGKEDSRNRYIYHVLPVIRWNCDHSLRCLLFIYDFPLYKENGRCNRREKNTTTRIIQC